jgi:Asp-tRNA(Asn)/Glu-tRNA(Gln) amidotransferase A subunit family amidase
MTASLATGPSRGLNFAEYLNHDAVGLAYLVRCGETSAEELLDIALERIAAVNPAINAVVDLFADKARAQIAQGLPAGPFTGVPFLLKDLFIDLAGTTTTSGAVFLKDTVAKRDSTVAERYRNAGLVIFGRTHSCEFGGAPTTESRLYGITRNPWNLDYSAGGSSGGASAAVAAGILPAANGSDAGGSIRSPAATCGLFGLKPTRGRVPLGPARFDGGGGIATVHALTRSVRDSAALLDAVAGPEVGASYASPVQSRPFLDEVPHDPERLCIAVMPQSLSGDEVAPDCLAAVTDAAALCDSLGHRVDEAAPAIDTELYLQTRRVLKGAAAVTGIHAAERGLGRKARDGDFEQATWEAYRDGLTVTGEDVMRAREAMFVLHQQVAQFMTTYDMILSPTTALGPFTVGTMGHEYTDDIAGPLRRRAATFTALANMTGQPAMSVPLFWNAANMPVGVQFWGRFAEEATLFQLAGQLERARPWFKRLAPTTLEATR